jgi:hypothetical protein
LGNRGIFSRATSPWLQTPGSRSGTSYYDSGALRDTLERLINFDLLNDGRKRLARRRGKMYEPAISFISIPKSKGSGLNTSWPLRTSPRARRPRLRGILLGRQYRFEHAAAVSARTRRAPIIAGFSAGPF